MKSREAGQKFVSVCFEHSNESSVFHAVWRVFSELLSRECALCLVCVVSIFSGCGLSYVRMQRDHRITGKFLGLC